MQCAAEDNVVTFLKRFCMLIMESAYLYVWREEDFRDFHFRLKQNLLCCPCKILFQDTCQMG